MKALAAKVNWQKEYASDPILQLLIDGFPPLDAFRYERADITDPSGRIISYLYYAELDGFVMYYAWGGREGEGFGGRHFPITMRSGEKVILKGPWSSRPGEVHNCNLGPCIHVDIVDDPIAFERGYTLLSGDVTLSFAQEAVSEYLPEVKLVKVASYGEYHWRPEKR